MVLRASLIFCFLWFMLFMGQSVFAQEADPADKPQAPSWDKPKELAPDAADYQPLPGPTRRRNVIDVETLFDGEHIKPYEVPYDNTEPPYIYRFKEYALLGSWSVAGSASWLSSVSSNGKDIDGFGLFGRVRFGNFGADVNWTSFDEGRNLDTITTMRGLVDLDIYPWLVTRVALGYADVQLENAEDSGATFGGEIEIYPLKPFSIEASLAEYSVWSDFPRIKEGFVGIGFFPTLLSDFSDAQYPTWLPEIRVGWRRIVGDKTTTNSNFLVLEVGIEF